jgi:hypothetical protein
MTILTFLMFNVLESIEANPGVTATVIIAIVGWFIQIAAMIWKASQIVAKVNTLSANFAEHEALFDAHSANADVHTTREQRESLDREMHQMRKEHAAGLRSIDAKIDTLMMHLLDKGK